MKLPDINYRANPAQKPTAKPTGMLTGLARQNSQQAQGRANMAVEAANIELRLGEMNINAVAASSAVFSQAAGALTEMATIAVSLQNEKNETEAQHAVAKSQFALQKFQATSQGQDYFKRTDLPSGTINPNLKEYGDRIPAHKVQAAVLDKFINDTKEHHKKTLSGPAYDMWESVFDKDADTLRVKTMEHILKSEHQAVMVQSGETIDTYIDNYDALGVIKFIQGSPLYSPQEKQELIDGAQLAIVKNQVYDAIDTRNPAIMQKQLDVLFNMGLDKDDPHPLSVPARIKLAAMLGVEIKREMEVYDAKKDKANALEVSRLEVALSRGQGSYEDIDNLFNDEKIGGVKRTALIKLKDKNNRDIKTVAQSISRASRALSNGQPMSPKSKADRHSLDTLYNSKPSWDIGALIAVKSGYVPLAMQNTLAAVVASGTGDQLKPAMDFYAEVHNRNPMAFESVNEDTRTALVAMRELQDLAPSDALELIQAKRKLLPSNREQLESDYKQLTDESPNMEALGSLMGGTDGFNHNRWFGMGVEVKDAPIGFRAEFNTLTKAYYHKTGDLGLAQKAAFDKLQTRWRTSTVNGKEQIMRNAPEALYPGASGDFIRRDINHQFGTKKKIVIMPDADTQKDRSYRVYTERDGDKLLYPLTDRTGRPRRYTPDIVGQDIRDYQQDLVEAEIDRQDREMRAEQTTGLGSKISTFGKRDTSFASEAAQPTAVPTF